MTILLIIVCNGVLLAGLWLSGIDLDIALTKPELYDPQNGYCVKVSFAHVKGLDRPMQVCSEWLDFSDPSGNTHSIREGVGLAIGSDGQLYYQNQLGQDYRLVALVVFVIVVIGCGMWLKGYLISRYQLQVESLDRNV